MLRKNTSGQYIYFCLVNASTGAALTGATVTSYVAKDGASQVGVGGTITEDGHGQYHLQCAQADTNGNDLGFLFTASGAVPVGMTVVTTAANPTDGVAFGLSSLPAISQGSVGSLVTSGTGTGQITLAGGNVTVGTNADKTGYVLSSLGSSALTEDYAAKGSAGTLNQMLYMILQTVSQFSIAGTAITSQRLDGATTAMTWGLDSATSPTLRNRAS